MNKSLWNIKRTLRVSFRNVIKKVRSLFYQVSVSNLKNTWYTELPSPVNWQKVAQGRKVYVEVGSGHGEVLLANDPQKSISIGYEIKSRFFRLTQRKIRKRSDIFVFKGSGYESLFLHYSDYSVDKVFILFPDPWHKKRHNKRRPLTAKLFAQLLKKLTPEGEIIIATDWPEYAEFVSEQARIMTDTYNVVIKPYHPEDYGFPITHYHQKWVRKGRSFTAIVLKKK